jgi:retron-type reverse transcriptase
MFRKKFVHDYNDIISPENLFLAWREFVRGKAKKSDVQIFGHNLADNICTLHSDLRDKTYRHGEYLAFNIFDPKPRNIHKASVRDRLVHHAIYRFLYPHFDRLFIADSFSCRKDKGTHRAMNRFRKFARKVSRNHTRTVWVLKCDVRKFFASIDHEALTDILTKYISDKNILWLVDEVINSFTSTGLGKGLPLGNLTSQLLVNIYMNEFDQFVKHRLKVKYYVRYADDFVLLSQDRGELENLLTLIREYLNMSLKLRLHPKKVSISTLASGIDFLGWVHFPYHRQIRTSTKRRVIRKLMVNRKSEVAISYMGLLQHGDAHDLSKDLGLQEMLEKAEVCVCWGTNLS